MGVFRGQVCLLDWAPRSAPKTRWWSWLNVMFVDVFWVRWLNQLVWLQHVHGKASCHMFYLWHHGTSVESSMNIFRRPIQPFTSHSPTIHQAQVKIMDVWFCTSFRKSMWGNLQNRSFHEGNPNFSSVKSCSFHGFYINSDFLATINWGG